MVSGHTLSRLICFFIGHAEPMWRVTSRGVSWQCTRCLHVEPSRVLVRSK